MQSFINNEEFSRAESHFNKNPKITEISRVDGFQHSYWNFNDGAVYQTNDLIGLGGSSKVKKVTAKDGTERAIKIEDDFSAIDSEYADTLSKQLRENLGVVNRAVEEKFDKNLNKRVSNYRVTLMPLHRGKTLLELISSDGGSIQSHSNFFSYMMLKQLSRLHKLGYVHRDIKPANFKVNTIECGQESLPFPAILDFQSAGKHNTSDDNIFRNSLTAPEARLGLHTYKSDIFSLGAVLLLSGCIISKNNEEFQKIETLFQRLSQNPNMPFPTKEQISNFINTKKCSKNQLLLLNMLSASPNDRPNIDDLCLKLYDEMSDNEKKVTDKNNILEKLDDHCRVYENHLVKSGAKNRSITVKDKDKKLKLVRSLRDTLQSNSKSPDGKMNDFQNKFKSINQNEINDARHGFGNFIRGVLTVLTFWVLGGYPLCAAIKSRFFSSRKSWNFFKSHGEALSKNIVNIEEEYNNYENEYNLILN